MGIFSSREKISVATQVARVFTDSQIVPSSKTAITKAIIKNGDLFDYLLDGMAHSFGNRAEDMYRYAEGHYAFGMPSGEFYVATQGQDEIQSILNALHGTTVEIDYSQLAPANCLHMGWMKLISDYGYNPQTNELASLSAIKGTPVYLKNMTVVIPSSKINAIDPRALEQWGISPQAGHLPVEFPINSLVDFLIGFSPVITSDTAPSEQVLVEYCWSFASNQYDPYVSQYVERARLTSESTVVALPASNSQAEYFHVRYKVGNTPHYWMYQLGSGGYPALDALFNVAPTEAGQFYPFTYLRLENTSMDWDKSLAHYRTSAEMLKRLGLNYQKMIEAVHQNPGIGNVRQAMLMFAVPANTTNQLEQRYLFEFFNELKDSQQHISSTPTLTDVLAQFLSTGASITNSAIVIQDTSFKMSVSNGGIYKRRRGGVIGAVGTYSSEYSEQTASFMVEESDGTTTAHTYVLPSHYYRKQISSGLYDEIQVINLRTTYHIYDGYKTIGNGTADYLIVPIDRALTAHWNTSEKEELYMRCFQYVFNSVNVTEVAWYSQSWFQAVLLTAAFVMAVYTFGASLEEYSVLVSTGFLTTEAILWNMATEVMIGALVSVAAAKLVQAVGPEVGIALAVLAAAYGLSASSGLITELPFADSVLSVSSSLVKGVSSSYSSKIGDIQAEFEDFQTEVKAEAFAIQKAEDLLQTSNVLSPFTIIGENPNDYYRRTMYSGNVGQIAIDGVATYVERALTLPTVADAIGGTFNHVV